MKKIVSVTLIAVLMQVIFAGETFAETKEEKRIAKVRSEIAKLGTGTDARIKVKLKDKTQIEGYLAETDANQFVVMNAKTGEAVPVPYHSVKQVRGNNLSTGAFIAIAFGIFIVVIILAARALK